MIDFLSTKEEMIQFHLSVEKHFDFLKSFRVQSLVAGNSAKVCLIYFSEIWHIQVQHFTSNFPVKHVIKNTWLKNTFNIPLNRSYSSFYSALPNQSNRQAAPVTWVCTTFALLPMFQLLMRQNGASQLKCVVEVNFPINAFVWLQSITMLQAIWKSCCLFGLWCKNWIIGWFSSLLL